MQTRFLILLLSLCPLLAEAAEWKVLPCWGGGYVQGASFCPSDPNVLYTYVDVGGPYRSNDRGRNWIPLHSNMSVDMRERGMDEVRSLSVDPRNADSVVILSGGNAERPGGFAITRDGGKTWLRTQEANVYGNGNMRCAGFCLDRNPFDPDELVGGEDMSGIFVSRNNGESWQCTGPTNVWYTDISYDATTSGRVYACSPKIPKNVLASCWCAVQTKRERDFGFFRSDDGAKTWRRVSDSSPSEIAQMPGDSRIIGIFGNQHIRYSTDGGENWRDFEDGLYIAKQHSSEPWAGGNYYAITAGKDFLLLGDGNGNMFRRGRNDDKWQRIPHGNMLAGDPVNEPRMANRNPDTTKMIALMTFVVDPKDEKHWLATDWFELWETLDAGKSWTTRVRGIMQLCSYDIAFDPNSEKNICCCLLDMGAFVSTDGGATFSPPKVAEGVKRRFPNNLAVALYLKNAPGVVMGIGARGFDVGVWRSSDCGRTWAPASCRGLPPLVPGKSAASALVQDPRDGSVLLAVSGAIAPNGGGVYRSYDQGENWQWEGEGLASIKGFDFGLNHSQGAWPRLAVSPDGSALTGAHRGNWELPVRGGGKGEKWKYTGLTWPTWKRFPIAADPFVAGRFLRGGESETLESTDGGKSWHAYEPLKGKGCRCFAFDTQRKGLVAFGCKEGIFVSKDGGHTLSLLEDGLNVPSGSSRNIRLDRGRMFFLTSGSGVWHRDLNPKPQPSSPTVLANPERGYRFELRVGLEPGESRSRCVRYEWPFERYAHDGIVMAQAYCYLNRYWDREISESKLASLQRDFDRARKDGVKFLLRFAYESDVKDNSPTLERILAHIKQLTPIVRKNKDVIYCLQIGWIGLWGEFHSNPRNLHRDPQAVGAVVAATLEMLPEDRMTMMRRMSYRWNAQKTLGKERCDLSRIGFYNDGTLANQTDGGTFMEGMPLGDDGGKEFDALVRESDRMVVDGELFWNSSPRPAFANGINAYSRFVRHHYSTFSVVHGNSELDMIPIEGTIDAWKVTPFTQTMLEKLMLPVDTNYFAKVAMPSAYEYIRDHLGYRLNLKCLEVKSEGGKFSGKVSIYNSGTSRPINPRKVYLVLQEADGSYREYPLNFDAREFSPGKGVELTFSVVRPSTADLPPVSASLWLPDNCDTVRYRPEFAIAIASGVEVEVASGRRLNVFYRQAAR